MRFFLEYEENSLILKPGRTVVGRGISCDIRFNDPAISRQHARFNLQDERVFLENLSATNGTLLNGERISGTRILTDGDQVTIGRRVLRVKILEGASDEEFLEDTTASHGEMAELLRGQRLSPESGALLVVSGFKLGQVSPPKPSEQNCPGCGASMALEAMRCGKCGYSLPHGRVLAVTQELSIPVGEVERRHHPRRKVAIPVLYTSESLTFESHTSDLSHEGLFIAAEIIEEIGTPCHVTLLPDGQPPLSLTGVVSRVTQKGGRGLPKGMGVRFSKMGEEVHHWISAAIKKCP